MDKKDHSCWHEKLGQALDNLPSAFDRLQEAHFWLHSMEDHYHSADHFRWCLGAFLKCMKEIPEIMEKELQNKVGFKAWFKPHKVALREDDLNQFLIRKRDRLVHGGMLIPASRCMVGVTELRGIKLGMGFPIDPREDSDMAMIRYLHYLSKGNSDFLGMLVDDEDSLPCVHREWRIGRYDEELIGLCARAWLRIGETLKAVVEWLGVTPPPLSLNCLKSTQNVQFKLFNRVELKLELARLKAGDR